MMKPFYRLGNSGGWTLVELVLTVAILLILMGIMAASYETVKARVRAGEARANMDAISKAAYIDYANHGDWAALSHGEMPDRWATDQLLSRWPRPPCPDWDYSWEDWSVVGVNATRVTIRRADSGVVWSYCVASFSECDPEDPFTHIVPVEISITPIYYMYCNDTDLSASNTQVN